MPERIRDYWRIREIKAQEETRLLEMLRDENCDPEIVAQLDEEIRFRRERFIPVIRERVAA
jgi:hypothetical protein